MAVINYTTPDQQIEKLKKQNLIIEDEDAAKDILSLYGYSNLIKSYREPYTHISNGQKVYRSGVTFGQIYSLYILDKELRNAVFASMLDLEEHIKEAAADVVASSFGTEPIDYLNFRNYQNKKKRKDRFTLTKIIQKMNDTLQTDKDPIHHYQQVHGIVPPWILFKSIYFTTMNNFIDKFKSPEKDKMVDKLYNLSSLGLSPEAGRMLMMDTLFISQEYRNIAAHGGRTYSYSCNSNLRISEIFTNGQPVPASGFSQLLFLLDMLEYDSPYRSLHYVLYKEVNRHCNLYPQDVTYLGQILNMDIVPRTVVYVTESSSKFHANPYCSGIQNVRQIELEDAKTQGYIPCKRCASKIETL